MTDLQRRMHETVCAPAGLTACLCGAYARVGEEWAREEARSPDWYEADLFAHRETERLLREMLRAAQTALRDAPSAYRADLKDQWLAWHKRCANVLSDARAALSAGAGEK